MNDALPTMLEAPPALPVKVGLVDGRLAPELMDGESQRQWLDRVKSALGIQSDDLARYVLVTLFRSCRQPEALKVNAMLAQIAEGHPADVQETILFTLMAATSMRMQETFLQRENAFDAEDALLKAKVIAQYGRLYARQLEALRRYHKTGDQKITVLRVDHADAVAVAG